MSVKVFELRADQAQKLWDAGKKPEDSLKAAKLIACPLREDCYGTDAIRLDYFVSLNKPLFVFPENIQRLPEHEGWKWANSPIGCLIYRRMKDPHWVGNELFPDDGEWKPKTWVKIKDIKAFPKSLRDRIEFPWESKDPDACRIRNDLKDTDRVGEPIIQGKWERVTNRSRTTFGFKEQLSSCYVLKYCKYGPVQVLRKFKDVLNELDEHQSIFVEIQGWPLQYIPRAYLEWLMYDRTWKEYKHVSQYDFHPKRQEAVLIRTMKEIQKSMKPMPDNQLKRNIEEYLELTKETHDVIYRERGKKQQPDLILKDDNWKGFFGTGYWTRQNTWIQNRFLFTAEGRTEEMQEGFEPAGISKPIKNPHLRYYKGTPERFDPDPTPESWEIKSQGVQSNWSDNTFPAWFNQAPRAPKNEVQAWKRILDTWSWLERTTTKYKNQEERKVQFFNNSFLSNFLPSEQERDQLSGEKLSLNYRDWFWKEQQREEDKDHWLHLKTYFERDLLEYIEGRELFFWKLFEEAKRELWVLKEAEVQDESLVG